MSYTTGQQLGLSADGSLMGVRLSSTIALVSTPLGTGGVWQSGWLPRGQYIGAQTTLFSDVSGSYEIDYSEDNGMTTGPMPSVTVPYIFSQGARKGAFDIGASYIRFTYTNGNVAQSVFKFEIRFLTTAAQSSMETLNASGADSRFAQWTKSRIETKDTDTGNYLPIYRTGNSLNVNVTNSAAQNVSGSVSVSNFPSLQPVSGSVSVSNFPATQIVSGTFWQATQPVSVVTLPLPTSASTETTLSTRLADATFTARINTLGQKTSALSTPVVLASDQSTLSFTPTYPLPTGSHANAYNNVNTTLSTLNSNIIDVGGRANISVFGTTGGIGLSMNIQLSADGTNFYTFQTNSLPSGNFGYNFTSAARYIRLVASGLVSTITATIVAK